MNNLHYGRLLLPKPQFRECEHCKHSFPIDESCKAVNCVDWGASVLAQVPQPIPLSMFLQVDSISRLCRMNAMLRLIIQECMDPLGDITPIPGLDTRDNPGG